MIRLHISFLAAITLAATPALAQTWTNAQADNNFADFANWLANTSNPPSGWSGDSSNVWQIDLSGADRAILGAVTVTGLDRNLILGEATGTTGELEINGGSLSINRNLRVGRNAGTTGSVAMTGGTLNTGRSTYIGQTDAFGTFNLSAGVANIATGGGNEELGVAHQATATGTLNISGTGTLNIAATARGAYIAEGAGASATVSISDNGILNAGTNVRLGFGSDSMTTFTISGNGVLNAASGFITLGQAAGAAVNVIMSGGSIAADRMVFANNTDATATLNMTGGTIDVVRSGTSTSSTTGGWVMQTGTSALAIGGNAIVNVEKLWVSAGGVMTISGDAAINIAGSTDATNPTFDFVSALVADDWSAVLGQIVFNGGTFKVTGELDPVAGVNYADLLTAAILNNVITTDMAGMFVTASFDGAFTQLALVPEPSTCALLFGAAMLLVVVRRRLSTRR